MPSMMIFLARLLLIIPASAVVASPAGVGARTGTLQDRWRFAQAFRVLMLLCALLVAALGGGSAQAQTITVDTASALEAAGSTITMNHTVGNGSSRLILVSVAIRRNDATVTSVTYAGQPLGILGQLTDPGGGATLEIWGRLGPTSGTNQLAVTLSNSDAVVVGAISFANVDQSNPYAAFQLFGSSSGTTASGSVASTAEQLVIGMIAANDEVGSVTAGAGQTSRWNVVNASDVIGAGSTRNGAAGSTTMSYTLVNSGRSVLGIIAIQPVSVPIVTNTNDSGAGSLRAAIQLANTQGTASTISFAIPGVGPHTIMLASALPNITATGVTIDGTTQSGTQCRDLWAGSGHDLRVNVRGSSGFDRFRLAGSNQTVRGLSISGFNNAIVPLGGSTNAVIQCNYLGLLANGTANANGGRGVEVYGAGARIGGLNAGQGNVISANNIAGIVTTVGSADTSIQGNFIGTDPTGMSARANGTGINHFFGAATWRDITRNLISGNTAAAIVLETDDQIGPSTDLVRIQRNRIGFTRTLSARLVNGGDGIRFPTGSITNVLIGGLAASEGNEITGTVRGISLIGVSNVTIRGNIIARSGEQGIRLDNVNGATIGGNAATEGNIVGGNSNIGIALLGSSSGVSILGNTIGPATITGGTFYNGSNGISIVTVNNVSIGNATAAGRNLISGNRSRAIVGGGTISNISINNNYIGTDATGNVAVFNSQGEANPGVRHAIAFDLGGSLNNVSILNNVIGGHDGGLLVFWGGSGTGLTVQGNNFGVGADGVSQINSSRPIITGGSGSFTNFLIGGSSTGQGNLVAFSSASGIELDHTGTNTQVIGNTVRNNTRNGIQLANSTNAAILGNSIFDNGLLGIDLNDNGMTANDAGDNDSGTNALLNFPQITSINIIGANQLIYRFSLDVPSHATGYRVEFFANSVADSSGFGEGERYLGHVDITHAGGTQSYTGTLTTLGPVSVGDIIPATTTRRTAGGAWDVTSEFSAVATATGAARLTVTINSEVFDPQPGSTFSTPANDMLLTTIVSNVGTGSTDADSIFAVIAIDPNHVFRNDMTPGFGGVVGFSTSAPALTFTPGTDLKFSSGSTPPTSLAQCTYTPAPGYDSQVRYVCLNPKGTLPGDTANGRLYLQLRARIN